MSLCLLSWLHSLQSSFLSSRASWELNSPPTPNADNVQVFGGREPTL